MCARGERTNENTQFAWETAFVTLSLFFFFFILELAVFHKDTFILARWTIVCFALRESRLYFLECKGISVGGYSVDVCFQNVGFTT